MLDVEVDVRGLGALAAEEALEEEIHPHRVDRGDAQAVADGAVRRAPAALTEDLLAAAVLDDLVHRQEVAAVVEGRDHRELALELGHHVVRNPFRVALLRALEGQVAEPVGLFEARGRRFGRVAIVQVIEAKGAALPDLEGAVDGGLVVAKERPHLRRRGDEVLSVLADPRPRFAQAHPGADAGDDVGDRPPATRVIEHLLSRDDRNVVKTGSRAQRLLLRDLRGAQVPRHQGEGVRSERLGHVRQDLGFGTERDQPTAGARLPHLVHLAPPLALFAAQPSDAEEPAERAVARAALGEEHELSGRFVPPNHDRHLCTADGIGADLPASHPGAHEAVDAVAVGDGDRGQPQRMSARHQLFGVARPLEEGVVALHPERHVGTGVAQSTIPWRNQRLRGRSQ